MAGRKFAAGVTGNKVVTCKGCGKPTHSNVRGMGTGLCGGCITRMEMENEHNDGEHEGALVKGCPFCTGAK